VPAIRQRPLKQGAEYVEVGGKAGEGGDLFTNCVFAGKKTKGWKKYHALPAM